MMIAIVVLLVLILLSCIRGWVAILVLVAFGVLALLGYHESSKRRQLEAQVQSTPRR